MNVYDFDGTIYSGDSTVDFYVFCVRKNPLLCRCLPRQVFAALKYKMKKQSKEQFKEQFFSFLNDIADIDTIVRQFWDKSEGKIAEWYLKQKDEQDVIISASPEFLLKEISKRLGIQTLIASKVSKHTGLFEGNNCYGVEKVKRFREEFPQGIIDNFYSDSKSDQPVADIAEHSFFVKDGMVEDWK